VNDNRGRYKTFCEQRQSEVPLFMQYWWMETVCKGKSWNVALVEENSDVLAAMPYHYGRRLGISYILMPQLTQFTGPLFFYPEGLNEYHRIEFEKRCVDSLLEQMESVNAKMIMLHLSPKVTNWLPFYWHGYRQTTRYTYRIEDISDVHSVFEGFERSENRQKKIAKYIDKTELRFDMSPVDFAAFHSRYWKAKGQRDLLDEDFIIHVCSEAIQRDHGVIGALYDSNGCLLAARFIVYDSLCAHSLLSAADISRHKSGHTETLIYGLIRHLSGKTKSYDFEGSMNAGIEHFYRSFGATQVQYFEIYKASNIFLQSFLLSR